MMPVNFVNNCSFAFKMANTCTYVLQGFQGLLDKVHPIIKVKCAIRDRSLNTERGGGGMEEKLKVLTKFSGPPSILMKFLWDPPHSSYIFKDPPPFPWIV